MLYEHFYPDKTTYDKTHDAARDESFRGVSVHAFAAEVARAVVVPIMNRFYVEI
jgi:hypothetical protein